MLKDQLKEIIRSQKDNLKLADSIIPRGASRIMPKPGRALILTGVRRCGKSTLLKQIAAQYDSVQYLNFEDIRLHNFAIDDYERLLSIYSEPAAKTQIFCFDELQNVPKWEFFIRTLLEQRKCVIVTGSNANLLSSELGTKLTGRYVAKELFPFSYSEWLDYMKSSNTRDAFSKYTITGGFPEYLETMQTEVLQQLLNDIIFRDVALRFGIRNINELINIALHLLSNISKEYSFNSLRKTYSIASTNTVSNYISYLESCYLFFSLQRFSYSIKKQIVNPKKIYCIDHGLAKINSLSFSEDRRRSLENIVFLHLRRQSTGIYYFKEHAECNFIVKKKIKELELIQVCENLHNENTDRELAGIKEALKFTNMKKGTIVTLDQKDHIRNDGFTLEIVPVYEWLTKESNPKIVK